MNERIKELAEQSGFTKTFARSGLWLAEGEELERFAELIRLDETKACAKHYLEIMRDAVEAARLEERELCAQLCDEFDDDVGQAISKAIRARGEQA